jgi:hypothetical protein
MSFRHRSAEPIRSRPSGVHASVANREKMSAEGARPALRPGLAQQTDQIVASDDPSLFVRPHYTLGGARESGSR